MEKRLSDLKNFYALIDKLETKLKGKRLLDDELALKDIHDRGVYFFFEEGENRSDSGSGERVVRVGTHAIKKTSNEGVKLKERLRTHKGTRTFGGSHVASVFRFLIGEAIIIKENIGVDYSDWLDKKRATIEIDINKELDMEIEVSKYIRKMPFLWIPITDEPSPNSLRAYIETNSIILLSNYKKSMLDAPSSAWLGQYSSSEKVKKSGLWNSDDVDKMEYKSVKDEETGIITKGEDFLNVFDKLINTI